MTTRERESQPDRDAETSSKHSTGKHEPNGGPVPHEVPAPSVQVDLNGFLTEMREWIDAVQAGQWEVASERLRDACDEAYCLEGWSEFTNRLGDANMQHHVHNLRRFFVAVETTARSLKECKEDETDAG